MASQYINKYPIPENFPEILQNFAREVVRNKPKDILDFGIEYFRSLENNNTHFNYQKGSDTQIKSEPEAVINPVEHKKETPIESRKESADSSILKNSKAFVDIVIGESKDFAQRQEVTFDNSNKNMGEEKEPEENKEHIRKRNPPSKENNGEKSNTDVIVSEFVENVLQKSLEGADTIKGIN